MNTNKNKGGRPVIYTDERLAEIKEKINKYTEDTQIPIVAEIAYKLNIRKGTLYDQPELADAIKRLVEKKESALERLGLAGEVNATLAIFSLKQMGWSDKHEVKQEINQSIEVKAVRDYDID